MKVLAFVYGDVHGVNFRSYSRWLAGQLGLNGLVRNEVDGSVKLFLDGEEKKISEFIETVKKRKRTGFFGMHVEKVEVFHEGEKGFQPSWKQYSGFEIDF